MLHVIYVMNVMNHVSVSYPIQPLLLVQGLPYFAPEQTERRWTADMITAWSTYHRESCAFYSMFYRSCGRG